MNAKKLFQYLGSNPNLVSGNMYDRRELARAFEISYTSCCDKLRHKGTARDHLFEEKKRTKPKKEVKFIDESTDKFERQKWYTLQQIADLTDLSVDTIGRRIGKGKYFGHKHIKPKGKVAEKPEVHLSISQTWLRKNLIKRKL